ncbi:MAG: hypothetical protein QFB87_01195 [Patescibacteria group bacterium]|nr:hypothetical protein [Patescibacteria group bacterium]
MIEKNTTPTATEPRPLSEQEFVEVYGEYPVALAGLPRPITINFALAMEAAACPADAEQRSDEAKRLKQLASFVGHEALKPEHRWLLAQSEK